MASEQRDILLEVDGQAVGNADDWYSDYFLSDGIDQILVSAFNGDTANFVVYVLQETSNHSPSDLVPLEAVSLSTAGYYVAKATVQLNSDSFRLWVLNNDPTVSTNFNISIRILSRSA